MTKEDKIKAIWNFTVTGNYRGLYKIIPFWSLVRLAWNVECIKSIKNNPYLYMKVSTQKYTNRINTIILKEVEKISKL